MTATRKWNDVGGRQLAVLQWLATKPRTKEYIQDRAVGKRSQRLIPTLIDRGLIMEAEGLYHLTDHGKAVLMPPDQYRQWKKDWGFF
tara:strand:- start:6419 stop:6679 length:261 start_codon:yes stop_codon:yes gene_type:complete